MPEAAGGPSAIKAVRSVIGALPASWQLPVRFTLARVRGMLEPEMARLHELVDPSRGALDVGANHGLYSYRLARLVVSVDAFEPQPACAATLRGWGARNVTVHEVGLSDRDDVLVLKVPVVDGVPYTGYATLGDLDGEWHGIEVPVTRLDDMRLAPAGFMKIDSEGHESRILRGAERFIGAERPVLLVEIEQRHLGDRPIAEVFGQIAGYGYEGYLLRGGRFAPLETFSLERDQADGAEPYLNNFVFVMPDDPRRDAIAREADGHTQARAARDGEPGGAHG